ncbi:ead/Ea22-like family protein [Escherichia coli]
MTDITELTSVQKNANIHRLSRLIAYASNDELRQMAVEVEHYTDQLIEALEKAQSANEYLREQSAEWERKAISNFEDCAEMSARIEELESQRKLAFAASNRWADKFREAEQRIAELESRTVTAAAAAVLAERKRQVAAEGWTPGHDDEYEHGELADAAGCYALSSELFDCAGEPPRPWPWPDEWWKPTNRRRDLVKAGALILAEIERLDRAAGIKVEAE